MTSFPCDPFLHLKLSWLNDVMVKVTVQNYRDDKHYPRIVRAVAQILTEKDFVSPVALFVEMGLLQASHLERWKRGQVPYLEKVLTCNLSKANRILRILGFHAHDLNLGPSHTAYQHKGRKLRFSKTGQKALEQAYSKHFVRIGKKHLRDSSDK